MKLFMIDVRLGLEDPIEYLNFGRFSEYWRCLHGLVYDRHDLENRFF